MKKFHIKNFCIFISVLLIFSSSLPAASAKSLYEPDFTINSEIALLVNLENSGDTVLYSKNAGQKTSPASLAKIVTAAVALENCDDLDIVVTVDAESIDSLSGTGSSLSGIKAGEQLTMYQLLACLLIASGNDAANVIANYIGGGDTNNFIDMMNSLVKELGCKDTSFDNAHGLDSENTYTTANDMLVIVKKALEYDEFKIITGSSRYTIPATNKNGERILISTNGLINKNSEYYYPYATGIKTGTTKKAGRCLVSTATKNGYTYLCIIMKSPYYDEATGYAPANYVFADAKNLFNWSFNNFKYKNVTESSQLITSVNVELSWDTDTVWLVPETDLSALVPTSLDVSSLLIEPVDIPKKVDAPLEKGEVVGEARIMYAGTEIARVNLVAAEKVTRSNILFALDLVKSIISSFWFRLAVGIVIVLIIVYILLIIYHNQKKKKRRLTLLKNVNKRDHR